jgi:hypothetical protein
VAAASGRACDPFSSTHTGASCSIALFA